MSNTTSQTSLRVSRIIKAPRARVYEAFIDIQSPQAKAFTPNATPGHPMRAHVDQYEPRVDGHIRVSLIADRGEAKGTHTNTGKFIEIVPNERIVRTFAWVGDEDEHDGAETRVTFTFRDVPGGTEVTILHEGLPDRDSVEGHAGGWTEALDNFAAAFA